MKLMLGLGSTSQMISRAANVSAELPSHTRFVSRSAAATGRPDLQTAPRVVSGGRALGSADNFKTANTRSDSKIERSLGTTQRQITLNGTSDVFKDKEVRQAFAQSLNREVLAQAILSPVKSPVAVLNNLIYLPGQKGYQDDASKVYGYSTDDAKKKPPMASGANTRVNSIAAIRLGAFWAAVARYDRTRLRGMTLPFTIGASPPSGSAGLPDGLRLGDPRQMRRLRTRAG